jgi:Xaa-Pro aminopeptidase
VAIRRRIVEQKHREVLPSAMRNHDIDLWLVLDREFNPDPMLTDLGGDDGGVRTAHLFFDRGLDGIEKIVITSHGFREKIIPELFDEVIHYGYEPDGLAPHLREIVKQRDPQRIGINCSSTLPMADGLTHELRCYLEAAIGPRYTARLVSAELVSRDYRTTRVSSEVEVYRRLCGWTIAWMETALSEQVIQVGKTTPADVYWWMREVGHELALGPTLLPAVRLSRQGHNHPDNTADDPIEPGDYLSIDAGLGYLNYHNDMKRSAYVLRVGETKPPPALRQAFKTGTQMRDLISGKMRPGAIGTEVWQAVADEATALGYEIIHPSGGRTRPVATRPSFGNYTHSVGNNVHDIGARVAEDWPAAFGDRVRYPMGMGDWYSVELHVGVPMAAWDGRTAEIKIEEQGRIVGDGQVEYFLPPQQEPLLIPRQK